MCWSASVSYWFSLLQAVCLLYAVWRGRRCDVLAAAAHLPVLAQEFISCLLWLDIAEFPDTDATHCSPRNRYLSFALTICVNALPLVYMLWAWFSYSTYTSWRSRESRDQKLKEAGYITIACALWLVVVTTYFAVGLLVPEQGISLCTYPGKWGHLAWAFVHAPTWYWKYPGYLIYVTLVSGGIVEFKGDPSMWPVRGAVCFGPTLLVPLWLVVGAEFGSLWCWSAGVAAIALAFEPQIEYYARHKLGLKYDP